MGIHFRGSADKTGRHYIAGFQLGGRLPIPFTGESADYQIPIRYNPQNFSFIIADRNHAYIFLAHLPGNLAEGRLFLHTADAGGH